MMQPSCDRRRYRVLWLVSFVVALWVMTPSCAVAQPEHPHLPPRPEPIYPTPTPQPRRSVPAQLDGGGRIELLPKPYWADLWTGVQWQDSAGEWHDVAGWQGTYNRPDRVSWFVYPGDFGKGPFRWLVYAAKGNAILATSQSFYLPTKMDEVVRQQVILP